MKPISPRPIFTLSFFTTSNQKLIGNSNFLAFSTQSSYNPRRNDDESRAVRVSVWWDFENCNVPVNTSAFRVAPSITNAIRANGIKGPIQITAFGDVMQISRTNQEALSSTGINLTHVPSGGKNSADRSLLVDLMYWVSRNPPPAHVFLISGDRDFAGILHRLRMNNYNILLASPDTAPSVLCSASTIMWQWNSLLKGETLSGKLFNQPPDGPYHSWYGHFKAPLQDPFAVMGQSSYFADKSSDVASDSNLLPIPKVVTEQSPCSGGEVSSEIAPNSKSRPIPKAVMRHIYRILKSYPEGISISQLRTELNKISYSIDRELYGYKKFSRLLSAMPHILELQYGDDGIILVRSANTKSLDEPVPAVNVEPGTNNGEPEVDTISKTCDERSFSEDVKEKSAVDPKMKAESTNLQDVGNEGKRNGSSISTKMQAIQREANGANLQNLKKDESRKASIPKRDTQEIHEQDRHVKLKKQPEKVEVALPVVEKKEFSEKNPESFEVATPVVEKKDFSENNPEIFEVAPPVVGKKDFSEKKEMQSLIPNDHKYTFGFGIFRRIWMKLFGSRDTKHDDASNGKVIVPDKVEKNDETAKQLGILVEKKDETAGQFEVNSKRLDIFAEESFWKEIESFIDSSESSAIFSKSKNRDRLVLNLQKQGPPFLKSFSQSELFHLVHLLISDKKWVEECKFLMFPFRLTRSVSNRPLSSNGLSHIFSCRHQESGERKHHNSPLTGAPQTISQRGSSSKSRSELLTDCQKVVHQIIKEHPEGFNIGGFRKLFLQKHGYTLDLEKLGYDKLVNLLRIMPEVRIESNLILPAGALKSSDSQSIAKPLVDSSTKDDDSDSSFDELGPAADNSGSESEEITGKPPRVRAEKVPDYEPVKEEEDFSDSEEETSPPTRSENGSNAKLEEEESVFLGILGTYYSEKGGDSSKKKESTSSTNVTASEGTGSQPAAVNLPRKRRTGKSYTFVAEQPVDNKDKLVDLLGSWQKSSDKPANSKVLS